jgi:secreted trypsin-like serine protease
LKKLFLLLALVLSCVVTSSAGAITYGEYDGTRHPSVGAMLVHTSQGTFLCSGSLIAPSVFLTASHCTAPAESEGITDADVTFDPILDSKSKFYHGTVHTNPLYNPAQSDPQDIAVVTFDRNLSRPTVDLPRAGLLDQMKKAGTLAGAQFTSVGYGIQQAVNAPGGPTSAFLGERWMSVGTFSSLQDAWLRLSQNPATGNGGTCNGDSGGPEFLGAGATETNTQVSITITGDTFCKSTNVDYRLDTAQARAFLSQFVTLP